MRKIALLLCMLLPLITYAQHFSISGTVVDKSTGEPVIGAGVLIKWTVSGTTTDVDGSFELPGVSSGDVITISSIGYVATDITVSASTSVTVDTEVLQSRPVTNLGQALQGAVPGLNLKGHNMNVMAGINIEDYNDRYMGISRPDFITVNVPEIGAATGEDKIEYASMFNVTDLSSSTEVLLWRQYSNSSSNNSTHYTVDYLQRNGSGNIWRSPILENGELGCPTGYSVRKGLNTSADMHPTMPSTTASVVFRAAEAYLNYIEAYYERFGNLGGNWTSSTGHR